jgi:hypothetical protein
MKLDPSAIAVVGPDPRSPPRAPMDAQDERRLDVLEPFRRQALAVAANDPGGDEIMEFVAGVYDWPEE